MQFIEVVMLTKRLSNSSIIKQIRQSHPRMNTNQVNVHYDCEKMEHEFRQLFLLGNKNTTTTLRERMWSRSSLTQWQFATWKRASKMLRESSRTKKVIRSSDDIEPTIISLLDLATGVVFDYKSGYSSSTPRSSASLSSLSPLPSDSPFSFFSASASLIILSIISCCGSLVLLMTFGYFL